MYKDKGYLQTPLLILEYIMENMIIIMANSVFLWYYIHFIGIQFDDG